jgi:hypothetical protein
MNTLEKLEALKAGELDKVLIQAKAFQYMEDATNAAKVEVAKAVVGEVEKLILKSGKKIGDNHIVLKTPLDGAYDLLNKLKEVL